LELLLLLYKPVTCTLAKLDYGYVGTCL